MRGEGEEEAPSSIRAIPQDDDHATVAVRERPADEADDDEASAERVKKEAEVAESEPPCHKRQEAETEIVFTIWQR